MSKVKSCEGVQGSTALQAGAARYLLGQLGSAMGKKNQGTQMSTLGALSR